MSKAITSKIDKNGKRYYPLVLIDSRGRIPINGKSYGLPLLQMETFTAFNRPVVYVEDGHPEREEGMSDVDYRNRTDATDPNRAVGTLQLRTLHGPSNRSVVVTADFYPSEQLSAEKLKRFEAGELKLGIRARVTADGYLCDIITWDLVEAVAELETSPKKTPRPPERVTVLVSANQGHTWFPAMFLWLGRKTFVWRNMSPGALEGNEIPENKHYGYFMWKVIPEGWKERTYHPHNEPEEIRQYLRSE